MQLINHSDPHLPPSVKELIEAFRTLPGIGPRSAQRIAYRLLQYERHNARRLSVALQRAAELTQHCPLCNCFTESNLCNLCASTRRLSHQLCVVETIADMGMLEHAGAYRGLYFVLMGHLSPIEGIGPEDIYFDKLLGRLQEGAVSEIILATNFTHEGEATAYYIANAIKEYGLRVTRLARGVPVGGELEYIDPGTLAQAFHDRQQL